MVTSNRLTFLAMIMAFVLSSGLLRADDLNQALKYFNDNNYSECKRAVANSGSRDALLLRAMLEEHYGDPHKAFNLLQKFLKDNKDKEAYLDAMWFNDIMINPEFPFREEQVELWEEISEDVTLSSSLRARASDMLLRQYRSAGEEDDAIDAGYDIYSVMPWAILGCFDNVSGSGFDKDWGVLESTDLQKRYWDRSNYPRKWVVIPVGKPGTWINIEEYYDIEDGIAYAQTFCMAEEQKTVTMGLGTSGSVKLWINDRLLFSQELETNNGVDTYKRKVTLNKGWNRILIQLGASEISNMNFMLRFLGPDGSPLEDLKYTPEPKEYTKASGGLAEEIPDETIKFFKGKIAAEPQNLINYLLLTDYYIMMGMSEESLQLLDEAEKIAPENSMLHMSFLKLYKSLIRSQTRVSLYREKIKADDPECNYALAARCREHLDLAEYDEAEKLIDKLESRLGNYANTIVTLRIDYYEELKKPRAIKDLVEDAYLAEPDNIGFVINKYTQEKSENGAPAADEIIEDYLDDHYDTDLMYSLAMDYLMQGSYGDGLKILNNLREDHGNDLEVLNNLISTYLQMQNFDKVLEIASKMIHIQPYSILPYLYRGIVYEEQGKDSDAIEEYKKVLKLNRNIFMAREKLRTINNKPDIFTLFEDVDLYELFKNSPGPEEYPGEQSLLLHREIQRVVYNDASTEEQYKMVAKVFNEQGVDNWKEYYVYANGGSSEIIKAEVLKANGTKLMAESNRGHIVFTNLEPGDGILLIYKTKYSSSGKLSQTFQTTMPMELFVPIKHIRYSLLIDPDIKFESKMLNSQLQPRVETKDDYKLYVWEVNDQPKVLYEYNMPELVDGGVSLLLSSIPDWQTICKWYYDISNNKAKPDYEVRKTVNKIFEGKQGLSQLDTAKEIYNFIVKNIRYSSIPFRQSGIVPQKASDVLITKIGDCKDVATLFVSMCRVVGIEANLTLIKNRDEGHRDMELPSFDFNHAIARAIIDGKEYYIELTSDCLPFSTVYGDLKKALALNIIAEPPADTKLIRLTPETAVPNSIVRNSTVSIDGENINVNVKSTKSGGYAGNMRYSYRDISEKERLRKMTNAVSGQYPAIQLNELMFGESLKGNSDTVSYSYGYTAESVFQKHGKVQTFELPWSDHQPPSIALTDYTRKHPLELWKYTDADYEEQTIIIEFPANMMLDEKPKDYNIKSKAAEYSLTFEIKGNTLTAKRSMLLKEDHIPIVDYPAIRDFYKKVIVADAQMIALKIKK